MSRQLHFISCVEDEERFVWETHVQLQNAKKWGIDNKFRIIVFLPVFKYRLGFSKKWKELEALFPQTKFFYYADSSGKLTDIIFNYNYVPIQRLFSLERHFKEYPELEKDAIFYLDSDVIFTKYPDLDKYLDDDVNYLSDTHTYLNLNYLEEKEKDVKEELKSSWKDVVANIIDLCDVDYNIVKENNFNTGGAQYLLKNLNSKFFDDCINICLSVRLFFLNINQRYFNGETHLEKENNGVQSWCADMWAIQWNLWRNKMPSLTPKWMDFAWATDKVDRLDSVFMLHNAGITDSATIRVTENLKTIRDEQDKPIIIEAPAFNKNKYKTVSPFKDEAELLKITEHEISKNYCTSVYTQEIINTLKTIKNES